jgi:uncharacterized membrane protein YhhN
MKSKPLIYLYFVLLILEMMGDIVFDLKGFPYGIWTFKPLLMPVLMFWYYKHTKAQTAFDKVILASLFFSWWGDNFLMPAIFKTDINFLLGLGSFLIAHVLYIVAFLKTNKKAKSILFILCFALPFALVGIGLISFLFKQNHPDFAEMSIPVMIYATVIMVMVVTAIGRYDRVNPASFKWVLLGALSFMISDMAISLNRFTFLFEDTGYAARLIIMPLYVIGQYLIAKGCVLQHKESLA